MKDEEKARLDVHLREFDHLKSEQAQRIGFRDNMLYVTLVAGGALASFALGGEGGAAWPGPRRYALLVIPWICVILGWTYVINDEKISAIGDYIKRPGGLADRIQALIGGGESGGERGGRDPLFDWERAHARDGYRLLRKLFQLIVDLTTFVASGFAAIVVFDRTSGAAPYSAGLQTLLYLEGLMLVLLAGWIVKYSGVWRGHGGGPASPAGR
jgi:hypothetical protein